MRIIRCDRCGIDTNEFSFDNTTSATIEIHGPLHVGDKNELNLCMSCTYDLKEWIRNRNRKGDN